MKICIVVPMYNEENIARHSITTIINYISQIPDNFMLIAVNDGSKDKTGIILKELIPRYSHKYKVINHQTNKGYGAALRTGMNFAINNNYDYVVFIDSDLTNHPKYLKDFYDKMLEGYDYIKASRYIKGGGVRGVPFKRIIISRLGNIFAKLVTRLPLTDFTNGFRAVKVNILKQIKLTENSYPLIVEELKKASKITSSFCEIPNMLENRSKIAGRTKFKYNIATFYKYIKYLFI